MNRFLSKGSPFVVAAVFLILMTQRPIAAAHETGPGGRGAVQAEAGPAVNRAIFDEAHGELFSAFRDGPLQYSDLAGLMRMNGYHVSAVRTPFAGPIGTGVDLLVVAGASSPFSPVEIAIIKSFVHKGGRLLVLLHVAPPVARLTEAFDIIVSNVVIGESGDVMNGNTQDFYVTNFTPHPITADISRVAVHGTWALLAEGEAHIVAATSSGAWADMNRNRIFEHGEPVQSFGVAAVVEHGKGKVVVVADDAPFANRFLDEGDNRRFAENIIRWFMH